MMPINSDASYTCRLDVVEDLICHVRLPKRTMAANHALLRVQDHHHHEDVLPSTQGAGRIKKP